MILTEKWKRSEKDKKKVRVKKSGCVELNRIYYCIEKFNMTLSLYEVLEITFYFSKSFSEAAAEVLQFFKWP